MYMPYLHGKQEELLALVELSPTLGNNVVPIVKPVNVDVSRTANRLARIAANSRLALILNSDKGPNRRPPSYADTVQMLRGPGMAQNVQNIMPAFELRANSTPAGLDAFCRDFRESECVIVHKRHTLSEGDLAPAIRRLTTRPVHIFVEPGVAMAQFAGLPSRAKIILRDGFNACERNQDYPARSAFDDIAFDFSARGFQGFGDFCLIGDNYSATGGPARAVALHLSEANGQVLVANHFVSTSSNVDTRTMYFEALNALAAYTGDPARGPLDTAGVREYLQSIRARRFRGLGLPKRWSTMHHIETIQRILSAGGQAAAF